MHSYNGAIRPSAISLEQISEPTIDEDNMLPNHTQRIPSTSSTDNGSSTSEVFGSEEMDAMAKLVAMETGMSAPSPVFHTPEKPTLPTEKDKPMKRIMSDVTESKVAQFYRERARYVK